VPSNKGPEKAILPLVILFPRKEKQELYISGIVPGTFGFFLKIPKYLRQNHQHHHHQQQRGKYYLRKKNFIHNSLLLFLFSASEQSTFNKTLAAESIILRLQSGVDFTNVFVAKLLHTKMPNAQKIQSICQSFCTFGICMRKSCE
jgi:hypothetical protein